MDDENDEDSDYDYDDDSTGIVGYNNGSHHGSGMTISGGRRRILGYVCDLPTISFDILDDGTTTATVADDDGTTSTPFDYASYMPLKFGMADLRRHLVLGRSNSGSKTKSLTDEVEEAHRSRRGKERNKREQRRQSTVDPLKGAIVYFFESILENDASGLADSEGKTNADARATPLSMATEATQAAVSNAGTSHHSKNEDGPTRVGDQSVALTLASALGAVLGYSSCPLSEPLKNQEQLNEESRQARGVVIVSPFYLSSCTSPLYSYTLGFFFNSYLSQVDDGAPLPPEAFTSRTSAIAGKSKSVPHNNTEASPPSVPPPPRSSPGLEDDELDAHQHGLEYNEQSRRSIRASDVVDTHNDNEVGFKSASAERREPEESMAVIQARNMHREGVISADELSEVIARDRRFSAHFDLDKPDGGNGRANADAVSGEATTRLNYELVEAEELAGGAFRALRVACGIQLSSFAHSLGGGPLLALSSPEGNASSNGGSAATAKVFLSQDQMFVLKEVTPREAALLLALLPDYIRSACMIILLLSIIQCALVHSYWFTALKLLHVTVAVVQVSRISILSYQLYALPSCGFLSIIVSYQAHFSERVPHIASQVSRFIQSAIWSALLYRKQRQQQAFRWACKPGGSAAKPYDRRYALSRVASTCSITRFFQRRIRVYQDCLDTTAACAAKGSL